MDEDDTFRMLKKPSFAEMRAILFGTRYDEFFLMPLEEFHDEIRKYGWEPIILEEECKAYNERG